MYAEAQRQELVGHHEFIVEAEVAGGEEVASRAGDDVVMSIAGGGDRALTDDRSGMVMQATVQLRVPVDLRGELGRRDWRKSPPSGTRPRSR